MKWRRAAAGRKEARSLGRRRDARGRGSRALFGRCRPIEPRPAGSRAMQLLALTVLLCSAPWRAEAGWSQRLARRPDNVLADFSAYQDISVAHFHVPENLVSVAFKFTAKEAKDGGIGVCEPRDVSISLKPGSLPLVRPDGSRIEARLLGGHSRPRNYSLEVLSNGDEHVVNIVAPPPGDWYAIAYRAYQDPEDARIKQQGLGASCDTVLDVELAVERAALLLAPAPGERRLLLSRGANGSDSAVVQFRVPEATEWAELLLASSCGAECALAVHVSTPTGHLIGRLLRGATRPLRLRLRPRDAALHYVTLRLERGPETEVSLSLQPGPEPEPRLSEVRLVRKSLPDFFLFDYEHLGEQANASKPTAFNVTARRPRVLRFRVGPVYDVGGTLSVGLRLAEADRHNESTRVVVVGCLSLGRVSRVGPHGRCDEEPDTDGDDDGDDDEDDDGDEGGAEVHGRACDLLAANRSSPGFVHAPFPEPGVWQLTARAFCLRPDCGCFERCASGTNLSDSATACGEQCDCFEECELATLEAAIGSSPCVEGGCGGAHGRCVNYMSGGFVYSACHCFGGWRGFDCADDAKLIGRGQLLGQLLALTLSNLGFVGAVYAAIRRGHYAEAPVYAAVCIFSSFYHACEAGQEGHSFCLLRLSVLQFCDFYYALLSVWVTLVAMASLGPRASGFCDLLGALVLALGAEVDRTALWVFLLPAASGCALVLACWALKCRRKGSLQYPARIYRLVYLPLGLLVVSAGLGCYAFLQTRRNYYVVHSLWHVCVAAGVVLLLPKKHYMQ
ncbi:post-GPI attachment to proteins factor 6-like isoform X2 [Phymastichus coffea]|uniref:post-GPI attachment to proteins factor 6-like isoform X2 n=1 Tax=Phymastichus coffea TaxID=108790 RepID=UPI00273BCA18|nr:post-GPI attachment to proteins factor 6-like isoform X2 [Phymastichus coffea]